MKKIMLFIVLICFVQIHAQKVVLDKWAQGSYNTLVKEHGTVAGITTKHLKMSNILRESYADKRDALDISPILSLSLRNMILNFNTESNKYYDSKYASSIIPGSSFGSARNLYSKGVFKRKLNREVKYMQTFAGKRALGAVNQLKISHGDRILLLLNGLENMIQFTLKTEEY